MAANVRKSVVLVVVAMVGATAGTAPVAAERPVGLEDVLVQERSEISEPSEAAIDFESFGRWSIPGFDHVAAVPGDARVLTVSAPSAGQRLVLLDVQTGAFETGAQAPEEVRGMDVSSDGRWAYVRAFGDASSGASVVRRFGLDALSFDADVDFGPLSSSDDIHDLVTVPGSPELALVSVGSSIALVRGATVLPSTVSGASMPHSLVAIDSTLAFGLRDSTLYRIELSDDGVEAVTQVATNTAVEEPYVVGANVVVGRELFAIDGSVRRTGSTFELARQDPSLPARYLDTSDIFDPDLGEFDAASIIFDEVSEAEISTISPPCFRLTDSEVLLGDGLRVAWNGLGTLEVIDIPDACGSYGEFTPVEPARVLDSRTGQGMPGARQIRSGETIGVKIHGFAGVPETGVESVVLNVTALRQNGVGDGKNFVTVWPSGFPRPTVSNLNVGEREIVGNMVTVSTADGGFVDMYNDRGTVDLTVDVMGYFSSSLAPSGARFRSVDNVRLIDTRVTGGRLGPAGSVSVDLNGRPLGGFGYSADDVVAAVVNVTAVQPTSISHFRIFPTGADLPDASSANFIPGVNTNRLVTVKTSGASFDVWNSGGDVDVTVDLVGVYVANDIVDESRNGRFIGLVPYREFDSRIDSPFDGDGSLPPGGLVSTSGWRSGIDLVANLTAVRPTAPGFMSSGPWFGDFGPFLETSSVNFGRGAIVANQAIITSSPGGEIGIFNSDGNTHVAMDLFGYYTPG